jgi:hypothetical protein
MRKRGLSNGPVSSGEHRLPLIKAGNSKPQLRRIAQDSLEPGGSVAVIATPHSDCGFSIRQREAELMPLLDDASVRINW